MKGDRARISPPDLTRSGKSLWRETLRHLIGQGTWEDSDRPALERYVRSVERARLAREERAGALTAVGSQGQLVQHPNLRTEREAERDARDYALDLLLTPMARKRHEVEVRAGEGKFNGRV